MSCQASSAWIHLYRAATHYVQTYSSFTTFTSSTNRPEKRSSPLTCISAVFAYPYKNYSDMIIIFLILLDFSQNKPIRWEAIDSRCPLKYLDKTSGSVGNLNDKQAGYGAGVFLAVKPGAVIVSLSLFSFYYQFVRIRLLLFYCYSTKEKHGQE